MKLMPLMSVDRSCLVSCRRISHFTENLNMAEIKYIQKLKTGKQRNLNVDYKNVMLEND